MSRIAAVALFIVPVLALTGCGREIGASSAEEPSTTASPSSQATADPAASPEAVMYRCVSSSDDEATWELVLPAAAKVVVGVQSSMGLGYWSTEHAEEAGVYRLSFQGEALEADALLEALALMDASAAGAVTAASPRLEGASIRSCRVTWSAVDESSSSSTEGFIASSVMTAEDTSRVGGGRMHSDESSKRVDADRRLWLRTRWTGPRGGAGVAAMYGADGFRLTAAGSDGVVTEYPLADYPHPAWGVWVELR